MHTRLLSAAAIPIAIVLFFAVNILASASLRSARLDLTEGRIYTLSEGSKRIARNLDEPVKLTLFYSQRAGNTNPRIASHAARVRDLLQEYVRASRGKITLEIIDPQPFTEEEDRAMQAGIVGMPISRSEGNLYFGLVGTGPTDEREVLRFLDPGAEQFLEYEISRMIHTLSTPKRKTVGILSTLPISGGFSFAGGQPRQTPPWQIHAQLSMLFDIKDLDRNVAEIPSDIDVLVVIHPKELSEATQYAIDQYVLSGGHALIFVDPHCEVDTPMDAQNQLQAMLAPRASGLPRLFDAWGVELIADRVAADLTHAQTVASGGQRSEPVRYVVWMLLPSETMDTDDPVVGQISRISLATPGALQPKPGATTTFSPLFSTSRTSMLIPTERVRFPDPRELLSTFVSRDEPLTIAARIAGPAKTAFPDGAPQPPISLDETPPTGFTGQHRSESTGSINVIIVADVDMLFDAVWLREQRLGNILLGYTKLADNGDFAIGAVDHLAGSSDLISIRARAKYARPFDRVVKIRDEAEVRYLAEQKALESKAAEAERRIAELQRERPGSGDLILSPEQQAELERFNQVLLDTRKELRRLQRTMRRDIEGLGLTLKFVNIGLIPLVVTLAAVTLGVYRVQRRRSRPAPQGGTT